MGYQPFQAFTYRSDKRENRILTRAEVWAAFDPANPPVPLPPGVQVHALWDTGATGSVISPNLATQLALTPTGVKDVGTGNGVMKSNEYMVNVGLPNRVRVNGVPVVTLNGTHEFDLIIGMDIIGLGDFSVTHVGGITCVSFRMPSIKEHDYVHEGLYQKFGKAKPFDACPCGKQKSKGVPMRYRECCQTEMTARLKR